MVATLWSTWSALHPFSGDTANSRNATVYALVHDGTWQIDAPESNNPFTSRTVDKVKVGDKLYSSKPPVMPLMMTGQYWLLHKLTGLDLDQEEDRATLLKIQVISFITIPYALAGFAFLVLLKSFDLGTGSVLLGMVALMSGSEYAGYGGTMNNHVPATACLIGAYALYRAIDNKLDVRTGIACILGGLLLGMAVVIDIPSAIFVVLLALGFLTKFSMRNVALGICGAAIPAIIHSAIMIYLHGSPLPFQMNHDYYMYEESYWRDPYGIDGLNHPLGLYLFNMTVGRVGVFLMYPVIAVGLLGLLFAGKNSTEGDRAWNFGVLGAFLILVFYYLLSTNNYGGASFGFRWFIIIVPFFALSAARVYDRLETPPAKIFVWIALLISVGSAIQCRAHVWSVNQEWPTRIFGPLL